LVQGSIRLAVLLGALAEAEETLEELGLAERVRQSIQYFTWRGESFDERLVQHFWSS
jgi:hypothetical protein